MYEIKTYAAPTKYVPDYRDNRQCQKSKKPFFWVEVQPCNSAEFEEVQNAGGAPGEGMDMDIVRNRCLSVHGFRIKSSDGSVTVPKTGADLLNGVRSQMYATDFARLVADIAGAILDHSRLSAGELVSSDSSPDSQQPATKTP
jgi:hypothetical protein